MTGIVTPLPCGCCIVTAKSQETSDWLKQHGTCSKKNEKIQVTLRCGCVVTAKNERTAKWLKKMGKCRDKASHETVLYTKADLATKYKISEELVSSVRRTSKWKCVKPGHYGSQAIKSMDAILSGRWYGGTNEEKVLSCLWRRQARFVRQLNACAGTKNETHDDMVRAATEFEKAYNKYSLLHIQELQILLEEAKGK